MTQPLATERLDSDVGTNRVKDITFREKLEDNNSHNIMTINPQLRNKK